MLTPSSPTSSGGGSVAEKRAFQTYVGREEVFSSKPSSAPDGRGGLLLSEVYEFLGRFVAYPSEHAHVAHALWIIHTHLMDAWDSTPRLAFLSAEPASGKTRAIEVTSLLVPNVVVAAQASQSYLFRRISDPKGRPTILYDEIDTVFGPKSKGNEETRAVLNAGHRRNAYVCRSVKKNEAFKPEQMPSYCAVALAGLGSLPETILTRSIVIRMQRRKFTDKVEPYRCREVEPEGQHLLEKLKLWTAGLLTGITNVRPAMPPGVDDRDADVWEPLLACADAAGVEWGQRARAACVSLVALSKASTPSLGIRLLSDLKQVLSGRLAMTTEEIIGRLLRMDDAPWLEFEGAQIDARALSRVLRQYDIKSKTIRFGERTARGYEARQFHDAWSRYLADERGTTESETIETTETPSQ